MQLLFLLRRGLVQLLFSSLTLFGFSGRREVGFILGLIASLQMRSSWLF